MLINSKKMLDNAKKNKTAVFQFNINNLEWTRYILEECNKLNVPVILGVSESAISYMGGYNVVSALCYSLISDLNIKIDVCLHLDHAKSLNSCYQAIDAGFTSVMLDMSSLPLEENIEKTKEVVLYAKSNNVTVESEIGLIGYISNGKLENGKNPTLKDCLEFVEKTNIDSLAPAVGTVHGIYTGKLNIDYKFIEELSKSLKIPLVLHGGSGLSNSVLEKCIQSGINKININSDIQAAFSKDLRDFLIKNPDVIDPRKIIKSGENAIKKVVSDKINIILTKK